MEIININEDDKLSYLMSIQKLKEVPFEKLQLIDVLLHYLQFDYNKEFLEDISDKYIQALYLVKSLVVPKCPAIIINGFGIPTLPTAKFLYNNLELLGYYYDLQFKQWKRFTEYNSKKMKGF